MSLRMYILGQRGRQLQGVHTERVYKDYGEDTLEANRATVLQHVAPHARPVV